MKRVSLVACASTGFWPLVADMRPKSEGPEAPTGGRRSERDRWNDRSLGPKTSAVFSTAQCGEDRKLSEDVRDSVNVPHAVRCRCLRDLDRTVFPRIDRESSPTVGDHDRKD